MEDSGSAGCRDYPAGRCGSRSRPAPPNVPCRSGPTPRRRAAAKALGVVDKEHRLADVGLGADDPVLIKGVIRGPPVDFLHHVGHLVPQAEAHREIRAELDFILEIPGSSNMRKVSGVAPGYACIWLG